MSKRFVLSFSVILLFLLLFFYTSAHSTKSRLSGMGDLSIVIEDESNMIDLWDFSRNPAGFLEDEKGSVIRGDFDWDTYRIRNLLETEYVHLFPQSNYKATGDLYKNWISLGYRKDDSFALGLEGNYGFRKTESIHYRNEWTSPQISLIWTQRLNRLTCFGASMEYLEDKWDFRYPDSESRDKVRFKNFKSEAGIAGKLLPEVTVGAMLGYSSFKSYRETDISDSCAIWLSGQTIVDINNKLKLGIETDFTFKRAYLGSPYYEDKDKGKKNYYYAFLKFKGIYRLTSKLKAGLYFSDSQPLVGFYYPVDALFFLWSQEYRGRHFGAGCSYQFNKRLLVALEYHLRDSSQPYGNEVIWGYKITSLNLGVEGKLTEGCFIRSGFVRTEMRLNPDYFKRRETWENMFTSGFGYQPSGGKLIVEFSYRYAYKKFKEFYYDTDVISDRNIFGLSLKKVF